MKRVFGKVEAGFDLFYLITTITIGIILFIGHQNKLSLYAGIMACTLGIGDAFHLLPRVHLIINHQEEKVRKQLGRGKQITSITMSIVYVFLWEIAKSLYHLNDMNIWNILIYTLAGIRILLCLFPQNKWTTRYPPVNWGIYRNIPFFLLGMMIAIIYFIHQKEIMDVQFIWLAILLSFLFYLPVVIYANKNAKVGMLMLPKTCCYLWILITFYLYLH